MMRSDNMGVIKNMIKNWLEIKNPDSMQIDIEQLTNFEGQAFINNIWYRGDSSELNQYTSNQTIELAILIFGEADQLQE